MHVTTSLIGCCRSQIHYIRSPEHLILLGANPLLCRFCLLFLLLSSILTDFFLIFSLSPSFYDSFTVYLFRLTNRNTTNYNCNNSSYSSSWLSQTTIEGPSLLPPLTSQVKGFQDLLGDPSYSNGLPNEAAVGVGCPRGVMVKAMSCGIVVREFVLQSRYYVHFRANTLGKGMNPLILPPAMGK